MHLKTFTSSLILSLIVLFSFAGEIDETKKKTSEKQIWAKSFLGKKAPKIEVEEWIIEPADMEGKYILIDIWATWCGPCRKGIPELNKWQETFKDKLVVIGISNEKKEKMLEYSQMNIKYANGYDTKSKVKNALSVTAIPHVIIINPEGIVVWEGFPMLPKFELTTEVLTKLLSK